jgi:hypothetical protein
MSDPYAPPTTTSQVEPPVEVPGPIRLKRRILGGFLAAGGGWGVVSTLWQTSTARAGHGVRVSVHVPLAVLPFVVAGLAGVGLWRGRRWAIPLAAAVLGLESILFRFNDFEYRFMTGLDAHLGLAMGARNAEGAPSIDLTLGANAGSSLVATVFPGHHAGYLALNVVAVVALAFVLSLKQGAIAAGPLEPVRPPSPTGGPAPPA